MRTMLAGMVLLVLVGCATGGVTERFPGRLPPGVAAENTVIRDTELYGAAIVTLIQLDGWTVAALGPGERVTFDLPPGTYSIGIKSGSMSLRFEAGTLNFFFVSNNGGTSAVPSIIRITETEAAPWLDSTVDVSGRRWPCRSCGAAAAPWLDSTVDVSAIKPTCRDSLGLSLEAQCRERPSR